MYSGTAAIRIERHMPNNVQQRLVLGYSGLLQQSLQAIAGRAHYAERYLRRVNIS